MILFGLGDGVKKAFYLLAAECAGIVVGTAEVEVDLHFLHL